MLDQLTTSYDKITGLLDELKTVDADGHLSFPASSSTISSLTN